MTQPATKRLITEALLAARTQVISAEVSVANTTTETQLLGVTIPGNVPVVGTTYRVTAILNTDNIATSGTLTLRLRWGGVGGVTLASLVIPSQTTLATGKSGRVEFDMTVRTIGATGTASAGGFVRTEIGTAGGVSLAGGTNSQTIDTTVNKVLSLTAQWATANAGNVCRAEVAMFEIVRA